MFSISQHCMLTIALHGIGSDSYLFLEFDDLKDKSA